MKLLLQIKQEQALIGGTSRSVFQRAEKKLAQEEYSIALREIAKNKKADRYVSVMDFLFVESFPSPWRYRCFRFYANKGPCLREDPHVSHELISKYDIALCNILDICLELHKQNCNHWSVISGILDMAMPKAH